MSEWNVDDWTDLGGFYGGSEELCGRWEITQKPGLVITPLGAVCIGTSIWHRDKVGRCKLQLETLVYTLNKSPWATWQQSSKRRTFKLLPVDRLATGTVMRCEVDALEHKLQDTKYEKSAPGETKAGHVNNYSQ